MENIIEVKNLVKYYNNTKAVKDISFSVKKGSFFAFLGENGAGKSTTINILSTVLLKNSGDIKICDLDISKDTDKIKNKIGIVYQNSVLDEDLTVIQNLEIRASFYNYSKKIINEKISSLANLLEFKDILKRKYKTLSGGQKRRVDIARGLINSPEILFLDEPTTGLDPKTRSLVWDLISKLRVQENLTVFLTTHYMEETKYADEVVILDKGIIVADDTPNALKSKFSKNKMHWYTKKSKENNYILDKYSLTYSYKREYYSIIINDISIINEFLYKENIKDYEILKGNMDDVFLNITGRSITNE